MILDTWISDDYQVGKTSAHELWHAIAGGPEAALHDGHSADSDCAGWGADRFDRASYFCPAHVVALRQSAIRAWPLTVNGQPQKDS
jgi:hypothetical protein